MTPEETELLSELTIVIPTYNRPLELERSIEYWRVLPVTVHILDGSLNPSFCEGRLFDSKSIYYHHKPTLPLVNPQLNVMNRLVFAASLPKTKYSVVSCDDDFYTFSGLIESLRILESRPEVDAVAGRIASYEVKQNQIRWHMKYNFKAQNVALSPSLKDRAERSRDWFLYAVCRTDSWAKFLKASYEERSFTELNFGGHDWMMQLFSLAMFRTYFIEVIFLVRQTTVHGANIGPTVDWNAWLFENEESNQVKELVEHIAEIFRQSSLENESSSCREYAEHFIQREIQSFREAKSTQNRLFVVRLKSALLSELKLIVRKLTRRLDPLEVRVRRVKKRTRPFTKDLIKLGYLREVSDITMIRQILLRPREELRLRANI